LILEALKDGRKKFGELLVRTGLSRPALASNLKQMCENGAVERESNSEDYRISYYSLTSKGWNTLRKQEDIAVLGSSEFNVRADDFTSLASEDVSKIAEAIAGALQKGIDVCIWGPAENILKECISFSIYSSKKPKGKALENARRFAEIAKSAMLVEIGASSRSELSKIPSVTIVFRFNKDKIDKYAKTWVARKETLKLPDIKDYLEKNEEGK
jgi:DNA-binding MarR family transcriptional regulator